MKSKQLKVSSYLDLTVIAGSCIEEYDRRKRLISEWGHEFHYVYDKRGYSDACGIPSGLLGRAIAFYLKGCGGYRVEIKPGDLSIEDLIFLRFYIETFFGAELSQLWKDPLLSEFHYALDVSPLSPDDVYCEKDKTQKTHVISSNKGVTETVYCGGQPAGLVIYNKGLELSQSKRRILKLIDDASMELPKFPLTRIERRMRHQKFSIYDLIHNPPEIFSGFLIYPFSALEGENICPKLLIDSIHYRGFKPAMARMVGSDNEALRDLIEKSEMTDKILKRYAKQQVEAFSKLHLFAPKKQWKKYLKGTPKAIREYYHTGVLTTHLRYLIGTPNAQQAKLLKCESGDSNWWMGRIGESIERAKAEKLIRLGARRKRSG